MESKFIPFVVETHGGMGVCAIQVIDMLAQAAMHSAINNKFVYNPSRIRREFTLAISCAIQKGNVNIITEGMSRFITSMHSSSPMRVEIMCTHTQQRQLYYQSIYIAAIWAEIGEVLRWGGQLGRIGDVQGFELADVGGALPSASFRGPAQGRAGVLGLFPAPGPDRQLRRQIDVGLHRRGDPDRAVRPSQFRPHRLRRRHLHTLPHALHHQHVHAPRQRRTGRCRCRRIRRISPL